MRKHNKSYLRHLAILSVMACWSLSAQANISISLSSVPLKKAISEIEKVSELRFFYNADFAAINTPVSISVKDCTETEFLDKLFTGTGITYTISKDNVVTLHIKKENDADKTQNNLRSIKVTGIVSDEDGEPLMGAVLRTKEGNQSTTTALDGSFTLDSVNPDDKIEVTFFGYAPQVFVPKADVSNDIRMSTSTMNLDEVVVVGYGTQKKANLTGAVSVIKSDDITGRPTSTAASALQGADPSMNITFGSGGPNAGYSIDIRGVASINGGSPLILVDGCEMNLSRINANDIESVSILKDASAAAIYGAKASSGVVLITTKSGKNNDQPRVTFDVKAGWKAPTASTDFITSGYWGAYINDMFLYEHAGFGFTTYTDADYAELWMRTGQNVESAERPWAVVQPDGSYKYYANFDWYNHYFKTTRPTQDYNVSITGGTEKVNYYISGRIYTEDGMIRQNNDKMKSYALRSKINVNITDWLKYGINMSYFESEYNYPGGNDLNYTFRGSALHSLPYIPSTNPDGTSVYTNKYNYNGSIMVGNGLNAILNYGKHKNVEKNREFMMKNDVVLSLTKDWTINADFGYVFRNYEAENRRVSVPYSDIAGVVSYIDPATTSLSRNQYAQRHTRISQTTYNAYTTYAPKFGEHSLTIMAGTNGEIYSHRSLKAARYDLLSNELNSFNLATGEIPELVEDVYKSHTIGFFGRVNYDYAGKYLFEASGRYDGSSRFHKDHRWGFFPSASLGWRMSQENFWDDVRQWWNDSKLRISIGSLGNQQVGYYDYIQTIDTQKTNTAITLNGISALPYATESSPVAGDLTWEKVTTYNVGLDMAFLNNRLTFTGDAYIRDTKDMLTNGAQLSAVYGASVPKSNCANMRTRGWEIGLSWTDNVSVFDSNMRYSVSAGVGDYVSKITKFDNPTKLLSNYYEGMTLGEIWGFHVPGLFASDEDAAAYQVDQTLVNSDIQSSGPHKGLHAGDLMYADLDGDNKISIGSNTVDNPGDRKVIGNRLPRYNYNFRVSAEWKGFDLSVFFQGIGRRDWYPNVEATTFWGPYSRPYQAFIEKGFMDNVWTEDNPDAYFPRYRGYEALGTANQLGQANDRYIQNLSYLRLKNLTIGYTLPHFVKFINEARVYFSGENLFYWSPFKKYCKSIDPETAASVNTGVNYGFAKTFMFGLNVTF